MTPSTNGKPAARAPSTDWKEVVLADEAERFTRYAEALRDIQRRRAGGRPALRALHGKGNLGLEEHRPLGNMMRARDYAYRLSTKERGAAGEPDGNESF